MRINRYLALAGVASRRKADEFIRAGRVRVNGELLQEVGVVIDPETARVTVDGVRVRPPRETRVALLHKPPDCLVSRRGQGGKPTVYSLLPEDLQSLQAVGRLDFDTSGILLLTNEGELSRRLQHPRYRIERIYRATVARPPNPHRIKQMRMGIDLGDKTPAKAEIAKVKARGKYYRVEMRIREGRKHEVKRLLKWAGAPVLQLTRISFAGITAGDLPPGGYRSLSGPEISALRRVVGLDKRVDGV